MKWNWGIDGDWRDACEKIPFCLGTDCKSLYDLCTKDGSTPDEKRVALDLLDVREGIETFGDKIRWVPTDHMLVDCFTKAMNPALLLEFLKTNTYSLKYDDQIKNTKREQLKARKKAREEKTAAKKAQEENNNVTCTMTRSTCARVGLDLQPTVQCYCPYQSTLGNSWRAGPRV